MPKIKIKPKGHKLKGSVQERGIGMKQKKISDYIDKPLMTGEEQNPNHDEVLFDSIIEGSVMSKISYKESINIMNNKSNFDEMASSKIHEESFFQS